MVETLTNPRFVRSLTDGMSVDEVEDGKFEVYSESGGFYTVDLEERGCSCPDHVGHDGEISCKHMYRVLRENSGFARV
jgi:hypothetical protein